MFGIFSFLPSNKLFINRIPRAAQSVLQNLGLSISRYGPRIRLINSNYCPVVLLLTDESRVFKVGQTVLGNLPGY